MQLANGEFRKRLHRIERPGARFVTFSCHNRLPLFKSAAVCGVFVAALEAVRTSGSLTIHAWVIMPEHVHLLVRPARSTAVEHVLRSIKTSVAKQVLARWRQLNAPILAKLRVEDGSYRFWLKGGGFDRNVRSDAELAREIRYIHRNPFERSLVATPEAWHWSSARWWMGIREGELECEYPADPTNQWARWPRFM